MTFDLSRETFDPHDHYFGVVSQQGRVQLDADWNEWLDQVTRRFHSGTVDTVGHAVVPRVTTPNAFLVEAAGGDVTIGAGRMYVDGIQVENHGRAPWDTWDETLAELVSTVALPYAEQPYLPRAGTGGTNALPAGPGPHLVYLDVWRREVSHLQDPGMVEPAVGLDTSGRVQTVWQVRVLANVGAGASCDSPDHELAGWEDATASSGARLTVTTADVPGEPDPCDVPPAAGYLGRENQLYRVEVHRGGTRAQATFKWSRDNASVASRVTHISAARDELIVESVGRDGVLRFNDGDWVEIIDDDRELRGVPGELRRISLAGGIDDATRTFRLTAALPPNTPDDFPTNAQDETEPQRNTRVRRWDQKGTAVFDDGTVHVDVDANGGEIGMPPVGARVLLEAGLVVEFDLVPNLEFKTGDHWFVPARTVGETPDPPIVQAPPRGIAHHYARLAVVTFPDHEVDCRTLWPPQIESGGGCACTACVSPDEHNSGQFTIQNAIDQLQGTGGTICLGPGTYRIDRTIDLSQASSVQVRGKGPATVLQGGRAGTVMVISGADAVEVSDLTMVGSPDQARGAVLVIDNSRRVTIEHCGLRSVSDQGERGIAVGLAGELIDLALFDNAIVASDGIVNVDELFTDRGRIERTSFLCDRVGVHLGGGVVHNAPLVVADNRLFGGEEGGIVLMGRVQLGGDVAVIRNSLLVRGDGIVVGVDQCRVVDNDVVGGKENARTGISVVRGLDQLGLGHVTIAGNRVTGCARGVVLSHRVAHARVDGNVITDMVLDGILMEGDATAGHVQVTDNEIVSCGGEPGDARAIGGICVLRADRAEVRGNVITNLAVGDSRAVIAGITAVRCGEVTIHHNSIRDIGPRAGAQPALGIWVLAASGSATVADNTVDRRVADEEVDNLAFQGVLIDVPRMSANDGGNFEVNSFPGGGEVAVVDGEAIVINDETIDIHKDAAARVAVRGNHLRARASEAPAIGVYRSTHAIVTDNDSVVLGAEVGQPVHAWVETEAGNVSDNVLRDESDRQVAVVIFAPLDIFPVHGNMSHGPLLLNGNALQPPWDALNITF